MNEEYEHEIIAEGIASTVSRIYASVDDGDPRWLVIKSSTITRAFAREPHDILKELRILSQLDHPNIVSIIDHYTDSQEQTLNIYMPWIPFSLTQLLCHPSTVTTPLPHLLVRTVIHQVLSALAYLHGRGIAHRDIKPSNILLTREGIIQLIDFGICWDRDGDKKGDLWPEYEDKMYFEVSTGPYRAPELLFGPRTYDAFAADMWSLGVAIAQFYRPLALEDEDGDEDLHRTPLFDATRGEIGLAWSIFQVLGTPTEDTWPGFSKLPVEFIVTPGVPLATLLHEECPREVLDLITKILVYRPAERIAAQSALDSGWGEEKEEEREEARELIGKLLSDDEQ